MATKYLIPTSPLSFIPIPKRLKLAPPNGEEYQASDRKLLCKSTPFPIWGIPRYFLGGDQVKHFFPPLFFLCWAVGKPKLLEICVKHYPEYVSRTHGSTGDIVADSVYSMEEGIFEEFGPSEEFRESLVIREVLLPDNSITLGLCIGDNRKGIIRPHDIIDRMAAKLFDGEMPAWHLSPANWQWRRKARVLTAEEFAVVRKKVNEKKALAAAVSPSIS
ncbi:hypothetical protein ONZ45_g13381 [Pleurotus djamor]|nr:hypothetical protein ONZ45_g13381 [Pleurotus djamor]